MGYLSKEIQMSNYDNDNNIYSDDKLSDWKVGLIILKDGYYNDYGRVKLNKINYSSKALIGRLSHSDMIKHYKIPFEVYPLKSFKHMYTNVFDYSLCLYKQPKKSSKYHAVVLKVILTDINQLINYDIKCERFDLSPYYTTWVLYRRNTIILDDNNDSWEQYLCFTENVHPVNDPYKQFAISDFIMNNWSSYQHKLDTFMFDRYKRFSCIIHKKGCQINFESCPFDLHLNWKHNTLVNDVWNNEVKEIESFISQYGLGHFIRNNFDHFNHLYSFKIFHLWSTRHTGNGFIAYEPKLSPYILKYEKELEQKRLMLVDVWNQEVKEINEFIQKNGLGHFVINNLSDYKTIFYDKISKFVDKYSDKQRIKEYDEFWSYVLEKYEKDLEQKRKIKLFKTEIDDEIINQQVNPKEFIRKVIAHSSPLKKFINENWDNYLQKLSTYHLYMYQFMYGVPGTRFIHLGFHNTSFSNLIHNEDQWDKEVKEVEAFVSQHGLGHFVKNNWERFRSIKYRKMSNLCGKYCPIFERSILLETSLKLALIWYERTLDGKRSERLVNMLNNDKLLPISLAQFMCDNQHYICHSRVRASKMGNNGRYYLSLDTINYKKRIYENKDDGTVWESYNQWLNSSLNAKKLMWRSRENNHVSLGEWITEFWFDYKKSAKSIINPDKFIPDHSIFIDYSFKTPYGTSSFDFNLKFNHSFERLRKWPRELKEMEFIEKVLNVIKLKNSIKFYN